MDPRTAETRRVLQKKDLGEIWEEWECDIWGKWVWVRGQKHTDEGSRAREREVGALIAHAHGALSRAVVLDKVRRKRREALECVG